MTSDLKLGDISIGEGEFGKIIIGKHKKKTVAVKIIDLNSNPSKFAWSNETKAISKLSEINTNNYICKFLELGETEDNAGIIVMKKYDTDLYEYIFNSNINILEKEKKRIFLCICKGIKYLHSKGIAHLDLKPENILFDSKTKKPYICDFGSSYVLPQPKINKKSRAAIQRVKNIGRRGSRKYSSPEMTFSPSNYDPFRSDIYSLGILLHVIWFNCYPPDDISLDDNIDFNYLGDNQNHLCIPLLQGLLASSPSKRYSIDEILSHPYFYEIKSASPYVLKKIRRTSSPIMPFGKQKYKDINQ